MIVYSLDAKSRIPVADDTTGSLKTKPKLLSG
jgi:hypothetical protein